MTAQILTTLKEGKIRKNAKAKIQALLEAATTITFIDKESHVDDSITSKSEIVDIAFFWQWYEENYIDLDIWAYAKNGVISEVKFKDSIYWFAKRIILKFNEPKPVKAKISYADFKKAVNDGYVSPLNGTHKEQESNVVSLVSAREFKNVSTSIATDLPSIKEAVSLITEAVQITKPVLH